MIPISRSDYEAFFEKAREGLKIIDGRLMRGEFLGRTTDGQLCACVIGCHFIAEYGVEQAEALAENGVLPIEYLDNHPLDKTSRYAVASYNDKVVQQTDLPPETMVDVIQLKAWEALSGDES